MCLRKKLNKFEKKNCMKKSKLNTYKIFWTSEHANTPNPIIGANRSVCNIWPLQVVVGVGHVIVVQISIGTHSIDTHSNYLALSLILIPS